MTIVSDWPTQLTAALAGGVRLGDRDAYWQDWPTERLGGDAVSYHEPSETDVAARPYLLTALSLRFTVPPTALPQPPTTAAAWLGAGQQAVAAVVAELNRIVGPMLSAVLASVSTAPGRT